jgi:hypothetical protein
MTNAAREDRILELKTFRRLDGDHCPKCRTAGFILQYQLNPSNPLMRDYLYAESRCGFAVVMPCADAPTRRSKPVRARTGRADSRPRRSPPDTSVSSEDWLPG